MADNLPRLIKLILERASKNKKIILIVSVGLVGMLLVAFSSPGRDKTEAGNQMPQNNEVQKSGETEKSLSEFLQNINGAGRVEVMITYESGNENVYAVDTQQNSLRAENGEEEIKNSSEHIIIKTDGNENGLEVKEIYPKVRGVAVICQGGDNPVIKEQITAMVCALFNINSTQVSVARMAA